MLVRLGLLCVDWAFHLEVTADEANGDNRSQSEVLSLVVKALGFGAKEAENILQKPCHPSVSYMDVRCNEKGELTLLWINRQIRGRIPKEIGQLQALETLVLYQCYLIGSIPPELGELKNLEILDLSENRLEGSIPKELGHLQRLERLRIFHNRLSGEIPKELGSLPQLVELQVQSNQLSGRIPPELGQLPNLALLNLGENQLSGSFPVALTRLNTSLAKLDVGQNLLTGELPIELGSMQELRSLRLGPNRFHGSIPKELGQLDCLYNLDCWQCGLEGEIPPDLARLERLDQLILSQNRLTGPIPKELGRLKHLRGLYLHGNLLSGSIPAELQGLEALVRIDLSENRLTNEIPEALQRLRSLKDLRLAGNWLSGRLPALDVLSLCVLDLRGNLLNGELPRLPTTLKVVDLGHNWLGGNLSQLQQLCVSGLVRTLQLSHNDFTGPIPACLLKMKELKQLSLNNNRLQGEIPLIEATQLVVLTLHRNELSGAFPSSLQSLRHLSVLTLHENSLDGAMSPLQLTTLCFDNPRFIIRGLGCANLASANRHCDYGGFHDEAEAFTFNEAEQVRKNCPDWCGVCPPVGAQVMLHHNRLSCELPMSLSEVVPVHATALMGNMLGDGRSLSASWISPEERQAFLFYSPAVWRTNLQVMASVLLLSLGIVVFQKRLRDKLRVASSLSTSGALGAGVFSSNVAVLKVAGSMIILSTLLLLIVSISPGYHLCSPPLSKLTVANLKENPSSELFVILVWCLMSLLSMSVIASIPADRPGTSGDPSDSGDESETFRGWRETWLRLLSWLCWVFVVTLFSSPSILFAVSQALPAKNTFALSEGVLSFFHTAAPLLIVGLDLLVLGTLAGYYSKLTGIKADRLMMAFRLGTAWLLPLLITVSLHENCMGGWKLFWTVCQEDSPEHQIFNLQIWEEQILSTEKDLCTLSEDWWCDGRCTRSIVDNLTPLLLKKLLIRSTLQPLFFVMLWRISHTSDEGHLVLPVGPGWRTSGLLMPQKQVTLLTTYLEVLFFWSPFIPFLSLAILIAVCANVLVLDIGLRWYGVQVPPDVRRLSRSYLRLTLRATGGFQLWHAFGTEMWGRHVLLALHFLLLIPWTTRLLPVQRARHLLWRTPRHPRRRGDNALANTSTPSSIQLGDLQVIS
ncbi:unnamed protein product [Durusdinium trenchii]|uniref:Uncharacterized protein n=3 Tax=Durusdinium trenchii TaxID=1381693 RepID=A0ABP0RCU0_9DINO